MGKSFNQGLFMIKQLCKAMIRSKLRNRYLKMAIQRKLFGL